MRRPLQNRMSWRRAVILMVVLTMLALFAIVGLTAVLMAQNSAKSSQNFSKAWQTGFQGSVGVGAGGAVGAIGAGGAVGVGGGAGGAGGAGGTYIPPDVAPTDLFRFAYGQLIYDVDDASGALSALRGHSLARTMYGFNDASLNIQPFNGMGRISSVYQSGPFTGMDDRNLINYKYFPGAPLRDPERVGMRTDTTDMSGNPVPAYLTAKGVFVGGANVPVTYPNLDNLAQSASRADGTLLLPSLHRPWLFGSLASGNPNWSNAQGRYLTLRPRPADNLLSYSLINPTDNRVGFPYPSDATGDVKNRLGYPGGNDSIWVDLGFPVQTAADGRRFKPLFAFYVQDLDGRVNLNTSGNLMGGIAPNETHGSNQGWGKWEINLARVLNRADSPQAIAEWRNLFVGNPSVPALSGRYGGPSNLPTPDRNPWAPNASFGGGNQARFFAQTDLRPCDETNNFGPTGPIILNPASSFPIFPPGYDSGSAASNFAHARLFDYFRPFGPFDPLGQLPLTNDTVFPISDTKKLIVNGFTGNDAASATVVQLAPLNFSLDAAGQRRRNLTTLLSMDINRLGIAPWLYRNPNTGYVSPPNNDQLPPFGPTVGSNVNQPTRTDVMAALEKVDLDQPLRRYPHQDANLKQQYNLTYNDRFDWDPANKPGIAQAYLDAQGDRQNMASQIFIRLLIATGTPGPVDPTQPTTAELVPIRWMAQLAVNIVDFIDEDEISTPFNFYPVAFQYFANRSPTAAEQAKLTASAVAGTNTNGDRLPSYWVFGTELPPVLLNEVLTEYELPTDAKGMPMSGKFFVKVWAELYNTFPSALQPQANGTVQPQDTQAVPLYIPAGDKGTSPYSAYQVVIANSNAAGSLLPRNPNDNVLGIADQVRTAAVFDKGTVPTVDGTATPQMAVSPQQAGGFFIAGPLGNTGNAARPGSITATGGRVPGAVPWFQTNGMSWPVDYTQSSDTWAINGNAADDRSKGVTVLLRRLANPHMPWNDDPNSGQTYNPYLTMDYIEQVPLNDITSPKNDKNPSVAVGKKQPYAADVSTQIGAQSFAGDALNQHTLGKPNSNAGNRDWLVHLDRQVISPYELLNVSGFRQHMLTQKFITGAGKHTHLVPWLDEDLQGAKTPQSHRLYRLFAFLETSDQAAGISLRGRRPGLINLNSIWDYEVFAALCDPNQNNSFTEADVVQAWRALMSRRNPDLVLNPNPAIADYVPPGITGLTVEGRPILDPGAAFIPSGVNDPVAPNGRSLEDTIFQHQDPTGKTTTRRLFSTDATHPYLQNEMLTKIGTNITTRSNTFAVWMTTGFFEVVTHPTTGQPLLGEEIGRSTGQEIRHRFFAVVDRTALAIAPMLTSSVLGAQVTPSSQPQWLNVQPKQVANQTTLGLNGSITYSTGSQVAWQIVPGSILVIDRGMANEETVVVTGVDNSNVNAPRFQAIFRRDHSPSLFLPAMGAFGITMPGNPGPQPNWLPWSSYETPVVPYWEDLGQG